jgi:hypothetical protein
MAIKRTCRKNSYFIVPVLVILFLSCNSSDTRTGNTGGDTLEFYSRADFETTPKIDAHVHVNTTDSQLVSQAKRDNFKLFTINWDDVNDPPPMELQQQYALHLQHLFPGDISYATTISIRNFNNQNWLPATLAYLDSSIAKGAKAVKIYKVIGMSLRDTQRNLVMIDDSRFDTVFSHLEKRNIPVVGHLGEPRNCWLPVDEMTVKGDKSYFSQNPKYHMYKHPEMPSYEEQIRARDNVLAKHPRLKFIGAHLGSLEYDVDSLAARLDRFPNMAVDMAARIVHLQYQAKGNWQKVHDFLTKYSDRLLYSTDLLVDDKTDMQVARKEAHDTWLSDWDFFTSDQQMSSSQFDGTFKGMKLPRHVVDNIYYKNAQRWLNAFN